MWNHCLLDYLKGSWTVIILSTSTSEVHVFCQLGFRAEGLGFVYGVWDLHMGWPQKGFGLGRYITIQHCYRIRRESTIL